MIWKQLKRHFLGMAALIILALFCFVGLYAPFFASGKPLIVIYNGVVYFPLFRYLFFEGYYSKWIDLFFNLLMFTCPILFFLRFRRLAIVFVTICQIALFAYIVSGAIDDPASDPALNLAKQQAIQKKAPFTFSFTLKYLNDYGQLGLVLDYLRNKQHHEIIQSYADQSFLPTLYGMERRRYQKAQKLHSQADSKLQYMQQRLLWQQEQIEKVSFILWPLVRTYHWEEDAGGGQSLNKQLPWWELTRLNRKDLVAALIFGIRVSIMVGVLSVALSLLIGVPIGAFAGFFGGKWDIVACRMLEIWESMPTFFMLLMVVAMLQNKSIFLVIAVIGFFSWAGIARYIRAEFFKQRNLSYVEACRNLGLPTLRLMYVHILPNAIPPVLTLLPFAVMGAITSEAGLSFLGLGEESSSSWGVLMNEGRLAFPGESYLLWPPAIMLTILLIAIALLGDALRDCLDPKLRKRIG